MKHQNKSIRVARLLGLAAIGFIVSFSLMVSGCANFKSAPQSQYAKNQAESTNDPIYPALVAECGQDKADELIAGIGAEQLDLLTYGVGYSNTIALVNGVTTVAKLVALVGNDYALPTPTGLGAVRTVNLLNRVDFYLQQTQAWHSPAAVPTDQDTVKKMYDFINGLTTAQLTNRVVAMVNGLGITRFMTNWAADIAALNKMAILVAQVEDIQKVITLMSSASLLDADFTVGGKMVNLVSGVTDARKVAEQLDCMALASIGTKLIPVVNNATIANLVTVINSTALGQVSKMSYLLQNVTAVDLDPADGIADGVATVIYLINNVAPAKMGDLMTEMEDGTVWGGQVGGAQTWTLQASPANPIPAGAGSGMVRLVTMIDALTGVGTGNPPKLAGTMTQVADMTKMMRIIQDVAVITDMSDLIKGLAAGVPIDNLSYLLENTALANIPRMRQIVDGERNLPLPGVPANQPAYLVKMAALVTALDNVKQGPYKVAALINTVTDPIKIVNLTYDVTVTANLSNVINDVDVDTGPCSTTPVGNTAIITLCYMVENIADSSKLVTTINNVTPANVASLVNNVSAGSQWTDATPLVGRVCPANDQQAAGKKMVNVMDGTTDVNQLVFLLNNVANFAKMAQLINRLYIASTTKLPALINCINGTNFWNAGAPDTATGMGKMVNMMDNISNLDQLADVIDDVTNGQKLGYLVNWVGNSSLAVAFINQVIIDWNGGANDAMINHALLAGMMNDLRIVVGSPVANDIPKLARLLAEINSSATGPGTLNATLSRLLWNYVNYTGDGAGPNYSQYTGIYGGIGTQLAAMCFQLGDEPTLPTAPPGGNGYTVGSGGGGTANSDGHKLARFVVQLKTYSSTDPDAILLGGVNTLNYRGSPVGIPFTEAMVRMIAAPDGGEATRAITAGVQYKGCNVADQHFPGFGPKFVPALMDANSPEDLAYVTYSIAVDSAVPMLGCEARIGEGDIGYNEAVDPNFFTPCTAACMGW